MKTRYYILIAILIPFTMFVLMHAPVFGTDCKGGPFAHCHFGIFTPNPNFLIIPVYAEEISDTIDGFAISDDKGNVKQYPITELDKMPCEDFMPSFHPGMMQSEQRALIAEKMTSCLQEKGGYAFTHENMDGGPIDMDPDLSPSYAYDYAGGWTRTIISLGGLFASISALFLVPYFILKRKNIPSRPYLTVIFAGLLLYFSVPNFAYSLIIFTSMFSQPEQIMTWIFNLGFYLQIIPIILIIIAGVLLYTSPVIRKLVKRFRK